MTIDIAKAIGIVLIIVLHILAIFVSAKHIYFIIWDYLHFAVPIFVFASTYLFFKNEKKLDILRYIIKRLKRILLPYWIFLFFFFIAQFLVNTQLPSLKYLYLNLSLQGGVDINWFVLLFVEFSLVFPLIKLLSKNRVLFTISFIITLSSNIALLFYHPPLNYKYYMWFPWSTVLFLSYLISTSKKPEKRLLITALASFFLFILSRQFITNVSVFNNKYPPNIYYLSYGMIWTSLLFYIALKIRLHSYFKVIAIYLSSAAYRLYFIHYILLYLLRHIIKSFHLPIILSVVLFGSIIVDQILILINKQLSSPGLNKS